MPANTRAVKRRIRSVASTQQITRAMKMVAAAKLRRAQERLFAMRPYADALEGLLGRLLPYAFGDEHPLLMARLVNKTVPNVQADRVGIAREAAKRHQVVLVLKGAHSVVAAPDGRAFVNTTGNPGMASGGMGDVLTGIIGALLAQQVEPLDAALLGVYLHGLAGDRAADQVGIPGLIASDVIEELPRILKEWTA